jgi:hypothetical protein
MSLFGKKETPPPASAVADAAPPPAASDSAPQPAFAKADDVTALRDQVTQLTDTISQLRGALEYAAARPQAAVAPIPVPELPDVSDDEINQAISDERNPAQAIRKLAERMSKQTEARLVREVEQLKVTGLTSIAKLAEQQIATSLPHFKEYEKEIRTLMQSVPQTSQADPEAWRLAYHTVLGMHADERERRAAEAAVRQAREAAAKPNLPSQSGATTEDGARLTTPEDLGNTEWLVAKGMTPDGFVKALGKGRRGKAYKDWADYVGSVKPVIEDEKLRPDDGATLGPRAARW